ncbi:MAG: hypothetical protein EAZ27_03560 [Cytophagales bacterium]|nr:MAG: hypothetical protein EAZ27_03560 [Cytophagales bacterium]
MSNKKIFLLIFISIHSIAQDQIILKNGDYLKVKVLENAPNEVKYKKENSFQEYIIKTKDLKGIKYNSYVVSSIPSTITGFIDKILLLNGDTISSKIEVVNADNINYKSKNANNNVNYIVSKNEILGYITNDILYSLQPSNKINNTIEIYNPNNTSLVKPFETESKTYNTNKTIYEPAKTTKKSNLWFIGAKLGLFMPISDFGKGNIISSLSSPPNSISDGYGYAKIGLNIGLESAYFFSNNIGIIGEFGYALIATDFGEDLSRIPPNITINNKPWEIVNYSSGLIVKTNNKDSFFDFKGMISANHVSSYGLEIESFDNQLSLTPSKYGNIGVLLGGDYRGSISDNLYFNFGLDYFHGFSSKLYTEFSQSYIDNDGYFISGSGILEGRDISIQGIRISTGISFIFGK